MSSYAFKFRTDGSTPKMPTRTRFELGKKNMVRMAIAGDERAQVLSSMATAALDGIKKGKDKTGTLNHMIIAMVPEIAAYADTPKPKWNRKAGKS